MTDEVEMYKTGKCYIIGGGENYGLNFKQQEGDYIIAADAGYKYLKEAGITADLVVGDFDSLEYVPNHPGTVKLNPVKDETDTWEAVRLGMEKGYRDFHFYACTGGRIDHTIANIQLLKSVAEKGCRGYLYDKKSVLTVINNSDIKFDDPMCGYISVFSLSDKSMGVTIKGLKYEVEDAVLDNSFPLGVSNEFTGTDSEISVSEGSLLIVYPRTE